MVFLEAVLRWRGRESRSEGPQIQSFEDSDLRTKQQYRPVGRTLIHWFPWLGNRDYVGAFPNSRDIGSCHRQIKEVCEIANPQRSNVLQMKHHEAVWTHRCGVFTRLHGVDDIGVREGSIRAV